MSQPCTDLCPCLRYFHAVGLKRSTTDTSIFRAFLNEERRAMNHHRLLLIVINNTSLPVYLSHVPSNHFYWSAQPPLLHLTHPPLHTNTHIREHHTHIHLHPCTSYTHQPPFLPYLLQWLISPLPLHHHSPILFLYLSHSPLLLSPRPSLFIPSSLSFTCICIKPNLTTPARFPVSRKARAKDVRISSTNAIIQIIIKIDDKRPSSLRSVQSVMLIGGCQPVRNSHPIKFKYKL